MESAAHLPQAYKSLRTQPQHSDSIFDWTLGQNKSCCLFCACTGTETSGTSHCSDLRWVTFFVFKHKFGTCWSPNYCIKGARSAFKAEVLGHAKVLTLHRGPLNKKTEEAAWRDHPIAKQMDLCALCENPQHGTVSSWKKMLCGPGKLLWSREAASDGWT